MARLFAFFALFHLSLTYLLTGLALEHFIVTSSDCHYRALAGP